MLGDDDLGGHDHFLGEMFHAAKMSIIATRPDGEIIYCNPFAEELYGWQRQEILGRNIMEIMVFSEDMQSAKAIFKCLNAGEVSTGQFTVKRKDGSPLKVAFADSPIFGEKGALIAIVGISHAVDALGLVQEHLELLSQLAALFPRLRDEVLRCSHCCDGNDRRLRMVEAENRSIIARLTGLLQRTVKVEMKLGRTEMLTDEDKKWLAAEINKALEHISEKDEQDALAIKQWLVETFTTKAELRAAVIFLRGKQVAD